MENFSLLTISGPHNPSLAMRDQPKLIPFLPDTGLPDYPLGATPSNGAVERSCSIYRPWFSPYSYFVRSEGSGPLEGLPEVSPEPKEPGGGQSRAPAESPRPSSSSSSSALEEACPWAPASQHGPGLPCVDSVSAWDILAASKGQPGQHNGYKCLGCCRLFPTLASLHSHVEGGHKEGFSCQLYYRKLKSLRAREHRGGGGRRAASACWLLK
ncbi:spermatogenesis-associated protein 46 [Ornithorhynchus anatinus]|uniref:spermatogenesis-associated protein 46 n=1 Tax=Ornithorhynchus anatinus TaxID=9258 RepID=UPI000454247A|nr:spermatogenesis-associated protein 46 [Ornithorhynchus anatinus]